jgi:hypothetical protein
VRDEQRRVVLSALGEIEEITGVPASGLGDILASDDPESLGHEASP